MLSFQPLALSVWSKNACALWKSFLASLLTSRLGSAVPAFATSPDGGGGMFLSPPELVPPPEVLPRLAQAADQRGER